MICSRACAVSRFCGCGMPWAMMVDSSATTGRFSLSASWTSVAISNAILKLLHAALQRRRRVGQILQAHLAADGLGRADRETRRRLAEQSRLQRLHAADQARDISRDMRIAAAGHILRLRLRRRDVMLLDLIALE